MSATLLHSLASSTEKWRRTLGAMAFSTPPGRLWIGLQRHLNKTDQQYTDYCVERCHNITTFLLRLWWRVNAQRQSLTLAAFTTAIKYQRPITEVGSHYSPMPSAVYAASIRSLYIQSWMARREQPHRWAVRIWRFKGTACATNTQASWFSRWDTHELSTHVSRERKTSSLPARRA